jgi:hypothetical protein
MDNPARSQRCPLVLLPPRLLLQPLGRRPPVLLCWPPAMPLAGPATRLRVRGAGSVRCLLPLCSGHPQPLERAKPADHRTRPLPVSSTSTLASIPRQACAALHRPNAPDRLATTPASAQPQRLPRLPSLMPGHPISAQVPPSIYDS